MREIGKKITYNQTIQITKIAVKEIIDRIEESKSYKTIRVIVLYQDINQETLSSDIYIIDGSKYDLLMSAYPSFSPNKPENEYREVDLWYFIDLIRNGL